jgi:hypothetical protein
MTSPRLRSRRVTTLIGSVALVAVLSACGKPADAAKPSPTTKTPTPTTARKVNPYYDSGNTVTITATGFVPADLTSTANVPLRFVNHTKVAQRVQFEHSRGTDGQLIHSGSIPPGGAWSYTPSTWESATYHSVDQPTVRGHIQIQPPVEP